MVGFVTTNGDVLLARNTWYVYLPIIDCNTAMYFEMQQPVADIITYRTYRSSSMMNDEGNVQYVDKVGRVYRRENVKEVNLKIYK